MVKHIGSDATLLMVNNEDVCTGSQRGFVNYFQGSFWAQRENFIQEFFFNEIVPPLLTWLMGTFQG